MFGVSFFVTCIASLRPLGKVCERRCRHTTAVGVARHVVEQKCVLAIKKLPETLNGIALDAIFTALIPNPT